MTEAAKETEQTPAPVASSPAAPVVAVVPSAPAPVVVEVGDDSTADALAAMSRRVSAIETEAKEDAGAFRTSFLVSSVVVFAVCSVVLFGGWRIVSFFKNRISNSTGDN